MTMIFKQMEKGIYFLLTLASNLNAIVISKDNTEKNYISFLNIWPQPAKELLNIIFQFTRNTQSYVYK